MWDSVIGAIGAVAVYWLRAEALIAEHPRFFLIFWFISFVAGVWL